MECSTDAIPGITLEYKDSLKKIGVKNVQDLILSSITPALRKNLEEKTGIKADLILKFVEFSELIHIEGIGQKYAELLEDAGIYTVKHLASTTPEDLRDALSEVVSIYDKNIEEIPSIKILDKWISQAKKYKTAIIYEKTVIPSFISKSIILIFSSLSILFAFIFDMPALSMILGCIIIFFSIYELNFSKLLVNLQSEKERFIVAGTSAITFLTIWLLQEGSVKGVITLLRYISFTPEDYFKNLNLIAAILLILGTIGLCLIIKFRNKVPKGLNAREKSEYVHGKKVLLSFIGGLGLGASNISTLFLFLTSILLSIRKSSVHYFLENSFEKKFWRNISNTRLFPATSHYVPTILIGISVIILNFRFLEKLTFLYLIATFLSLITIFLSLIFVIKKKKSTKFMILSILPFFLAVFLGFIEPSSWPIVEFFLNFILASSSIYSWIVYALLIYLGAILLIDLIISLIKVTIRTKIENILQKTGRKISKLCWIYVGTYYLELILLLVIISSITFKFSFPTLLPDLYMFNVAIFLIFGFAAITLHFYFWFLEFLENAELHVEIIFELEGKEKSKKTLIFYLRALKVAMYILFIFYILQLLYPPFIIKIWAIICLFSLFRSLWLKHKERLIKCYF